ncbi:hypothetical protein [Christiangramia echinicola]|uniref:hypothetical protein n=1 Tax=Christiangramia echinicola TaxID=279359 RepID=UPI000479D049|nr:hypothetical protein [Christiangramia echinicola]
MVVKTILGKSILDQIPSKVIDHLRIAFKDKGLDIENDIPNCQMEITDRGNCWVTDTRQKTFESKGTLIGTFNINGSGFYYPNSYRNIERLNKVAKIKTEFYSVPRKAKELSNLDDLIENL